MRADKLRNKEKIISKAYQVINESSVDLVSLEDIAEAAEVTRKTVYNHFSSKEDLLKEMLLPALEFVIRDLDERSKSAETSFSDITESLFNLYRKYKQAIELATCHTLYNNPEVVSAHGRFMDRFKKLMISAEPDGYPLGLDLTMRLISRIYLPVLRELHSQNGSEEKSRDQLYDQFDRIIKGALCL